MRELVRQARVMRGSKVVRSVADELLENIATDSGRNAANSFRMMSRRFLREFGDEHIRRIELQHLQAFKRELKAEGLSPKTINHYLRSAKRILGYAIECGYRPYMPLQAVKDLRVPIRPGDKGESPEYVRRYLEGVGVGTDDRIRGLTENLKNHLYLAYLTAMRPSELLRIVADEGEWESEGVFVPTVGKTNAASRVPRRIVLTDTARSFLDRCRPHWSDLSAFAQASKKHAGRSCHFLRHSAAQAMADNGVAYQEVCVALGHYGRVIEANSVHYFRPDWRETVKALDILPWTIGLGPKPKPTQNHSPRAETQTRGEQMRETPALKLVGF